MDSYLEQDPKMQAVEYSTFGQIKNYPDMKRAERINFHPLLYLILLGSFYLHLRMDPYIFGICWKKPMPVRNALIE